MKKQWSIVLSLAALALSANAMAGVDEEIDNCMSMADLQAHAACAQKVAKAQETRMQFNYNVALHGANSEAAVDLFKEQTAWLADRERTCTYDAEGFTQDILIAQCLAAVNSDRADALANR